MRLCLSDEPSQAFRLRDGERRAPLTYPLLGNPKPLMLDRILLAFTAALVFPCTWLNPKPAAPPTAQIRPTRSTVPCDPDNGGITLPVGFCATVFADRTGAARHITVAPNGDVFVALMGASAGQLQGGVLALRDSKRTGHADIREAFGTVGGTGILFRGNFLYHDARSAIVRYSVPAGSLLPRGEPDTIVSGLPTGGHGARTIAVDPAGILFVTVGSRTNACQRADRAVESPGVDPCTELEERAGIWRFDAARTGQRFSPAARYATGIRNAVGLTVSPVDGALYAMQHGRDQLFQNWPKLYDADEGAEEPAEELIRVTAGDDFGWPYCYFDGSRKRLVLAPEYGGDKNAVGRCATKKGPLASFPGHWAPEAVVIHDGTGMPPRYRGGAFVSFHGSWNRAPRPQAGFRVAFVPLTRTGAGPYETFADGFAGGRFQPGEAAHRPMGLAEGPDGALYVGDDKGGRIWKIIYRGTR
ncbi:MAG: sorbosone dehydrogenase family protein [Gemmatimonadaceae bacterium]